MSRLSLKKTIFFLVVVCMLSPVVSLFAEGSKEETPEITEMTFLSIWAEDRDNSKIILELTEQYKQDVNPDFNLEFELVAAENLRQKVKVLMAGKSLPDAFIYESGKPIVELIDAGVLLDVEETFTELGIMNSIEPGAVSLLKRLASYRGLYDLPLGMNVEGIWYNKKVFADLGLEVPGTWDELMSVCEVLQQNGIQPFTAGGKDKWPLTRIVNMYVMRKLGVNAMEKGAAGELSFMDPGFIEAAEAVQDMVKKGYFGEGITTVDYNAAADTLFAGQAAMLYNGSWFTQNLNDSERNLLGPDGVGFFNIPLVDGGVGTMGDYSVNCGNILVLSSAGYNEEIGEWLKYVFTRFGDYAMETQGTFKGYKVNNMPQDLPTYTKIVGEELAKVENAGLWFEASMDDKTTQVAQDFGQSLFMLEITPEEYWEKIEQSSKEYRDNN